MLVLQQPHTHTLTHKTLIHSLNCINGLCLLPLHLPELYNSILTWHPEAIAATQGPYIACHTIFGPSNQIETTASASHVQPGRERRIQIVWSSTQQTPSYLKDYEVGYPAKHHLLYDELVRRTSPEVVQYIHNMREEHDQLRRDVTPYRSHL